MKKFLKIFIIMFVVFSTVLGMGMYFYLESDVKNALNEKKEKDTFENLDISNYKSRVNVLLMGVDTLETDKDQTGTRTDTIMLLSVDPVGKSGFILSIPRDTYVEIPGTNEYTKMNHAHSYGGTDLAIETVKQFINLPIHHYMKVDYTALFKTVDDLGGVEFDVPIDMKWEDKRATPPLNIDLKKGVQILDGQKAMQLLRFRDGYPDQDLGRVRVQQDFIKAVLKKAYSPASITKIPKYIDTIYQYVETDMSITNILSLMKIGLGVDQSNIETATVPGEPARRPGAGSVILADEEKMAELLDYLLAGQYENEEENEEANENDPDQDSSTVPDHSETKTSSQSLDQIDQYEIVVLNGSGVSGVARRVTDLLKIQDIEVGSSGNAASFDYEKTTVYYKDDLEAANHIKSIVKTATVKKGTKDLVSSEPDIVILIGKDFN